MELSIESQQTGVIIHDSLVEKLLIKKIGLK